MTVQPAVKTLFDTDKIHPIQLDPNSGCNTTDEVLLEQIAHNIRLGLPQAQPHQINNELALLVCGGPSLAMTEKELVEAVWKGGKVIAINGSYQWCIDRNIKPSAMAMIDAREFNKRFVEVPVPGCRYLLSSQCHPATFEMCRDRDVTIWHAIGTGSEQELEMLNEYYFKNIHAVTMGTTIGVRAISLLRMLGFVSMEIFGFDSCWLGKSHHSYDQPENDQDGHMPVWLRPQGRDELSTRFWCAPWHMKQFEDFQSVIKERGEMFRLNVHGPGLIATALRTGAALEVGDRPYAVDVRGEPLPDTHDTPTALKI